jgi:hypothetical protein
MRERTFHRWSKEDDIFIKENYGKIPNKKIAKKLGISVPSLWNRKIRLGLRMKSFYMDWNSKDDDKFIMDNYKQMTAKEMGEKLGRSEASINNRKGFLGRGGLIEHKIGWNKEELKILEENISLPSSELSKLLPNKNMHTIYSFRTKIKKRMGIPFKHIYNRGWCIVKDGRKLLYNGKKKQYEYRKIVEEKIGRPLKTEEKIHHINGNTTDNRIENLFVCSNSQHMKAHTSLYVIVKPLLDGGIIKFNGNDGIYELNEIRGG